MDNLNLIVLGVVMVCPWSVIAPAPSPTTATATHAQRAPRIACRMSPP